MSLRHQVPRAVAQAPSCTKKDGTRGLWHGPIAQRSTCLAVKTPPLETGPRFAPKVFHGSAVSKPPPSQEADFVAASCVPAAVILAAALRLRCRRLCAPLGRRSARIPRSARLSRDWL